MEKSSIIYEVLYIFEVISRISIHQQLPGNELILRSPEAPKGGVESLALREPGERYPNLFKGPPPKKKHD